MPTLLAYVRRALEMPPAQAVRAARELAAARTTAWRQRVVARIAFDRVGAVAFDRMIANGSNAEAAAAGLFTSHGAVLPVRWAESASRVDLARTRAAAAAASAHRFDLLGSGPVRVAHGLQARGVAGYTFAMSPGAGAAQEQRRRMDGLLAGASSGYTPIDWHIDFKSGYRWKPEQWFSAIAYGHIPGVDVKVPWELSRFQHIGPLGLLYRLDASGEEGARAPAEFCAQVVDWIAANPPGRGVNWSCAMDVGLRAVGWLIGIALFGDAPELTPAFRRLIAKSLHAHGRHIEANLEYHHDNSGNHYLSDIVGLLCIGAALPEAPESSRWCLFGMQELTREMERQVLADGVDTEGSVPYHHLVAELFYLGTLVALRLGPERRATLQRAQPGRVRHPFAPQLRALDEQPFDLDRAEVFPDWYFDRLLRMAEFAAAVTKPDGRIPQTGDNDNGRAYRLLPLAAAPADPDDVDDPCDRRTLLAIAGRLFGRGDLAGLGAPYTLDAELLVADAPKSAVRAAVKQLRASISAQHAVLTSASGGSRVTLYERGGVVIVRAGPLYLVVTVGGVPRVASGGHFHNDLLAFELNWDGIDFVVDGGTHLYTPLPEERNAFRATAAHNTIAVSGAEQRTWASDGLFRVVRDASVRVIEAQASSLSVEAVYGGVRHIRSFAWSDTTLQIEDQVTARRAATLGLNLHPDVKAAAVRERDRNRFVTELERAGRHVTLVLEDVGNVDVVAGCYSLGYGRRVPNAMIRAELIGSRSITHCAFSKNRNTS